MSTDERSSCRERNISNHVVKSKLLIWIAVYILNNRCVVRNACHSRCDFICYIFFSPKALVCKYQTRLLVVKYKYFTLWFIQIINLSAPITQKQTNAIITKMQNSKFFMKSSKESGYYLWKTQIEKQTIKRSNSETLPVNIAESNAMDLIN